MAEKTKSPEQLLKEYDDACADVAKCVKAVKDEERKPRTSPAHVALEAARKRKTAAAIASAGVVVDRNSTNEAKVAKELAEKQAKEQAKIDADFKAKGGADVVAEAKA